MKLPRVKGSNLNRKKMIFPDEFAGQLNLVFIAFLRWHQDLIDQWVPFVAQLAREFPDLHYYEFPTLAPMGFFYRTFLNEGMRAGIPDPDTRARTITLYLDKGSFREALEIEDERNIWLYLFDRSGQVLWRVEGEYTEEKAATLRDLVLRKLS